MSIVNQIDPIPPYPNLPMYTTQCHPTYCVFWDWVLLINLKCTEKAYMLTYIYKWNKFMNYALVRNVPYNPVPGTSCNLNTHAYVSVDDIRAGAVKVNTSLCSRCRQKLLVRFEPMTLLLAARCLTSSLNAWPFCWPPDALQVVWTHDLSVGRRVPYN